MWPVVVFKNEEPKVGGVTGAWALGSSRLIYEAAHFARQRRVPFTGLPRPLVEYFDGLPVSV
jgi:hypothetical protein